MFCTNCGKEINDNAVICPNCGVPTANLKQQSAPAPAPVSETTNTLAIVGFVLSFFTGLVGLIVSILGYNKSKEPEMNGSGRGFAIAGIAISSVELGIILITVICIISLGSCIVSSYPYY